MKAWHRQPSESAKAYEAFTEYLETDGRGYTKVAERLSKSVTQIRKWANRYDWINRAADYDSAMVEENRRLKIESRRAELALQREMGTKLAKVVLERLNTLDTNKISAYALVQMADTACRIMNGVAELETAADESSRVTAITIKSAD